MKGRHVDELKCPEWVRGLEFFVDITRHLNIMNKVSQCKRMLVTEYYDSVRAFNLKSSLWLTQ